MTFNWQLICKIIFHSDWKDLWGHSFNFSIFTVKEEQKAERRSPVGLLHNQKFLMFDLLRLWCGQKKKKKPFANLVFAINNLYCLVFLVFFPYLYFMYYILYDELSVISLNLFFGYCFEKTKPFFCIFFHVL